MRICFHIILTFYFANETINPYKNHSPNPYNAPSTAHAAALAYASSSLSPSSLDIAISDFLMC